MLEPEWHGLAQGWPIVHPLYDVLASVLAHSQLSPRRSTLVSPLSLGHPPTLTHERTIPSPIRITINGVPREGSAEARMLLSDFLRHELRLTGTHVGCEHGACGACTVLLDGVSVRSCLMFAVQANVRIQLERPLRIPGERPS